MKRLTLTLLVGEILWAGFAGFAMAQNTGEKAQSQTVNTPLSSSDLAAPDIRVEKFADWFYRCAEAPAGQDKSKAHCEVVQVAQVQQNDVPVNVLTVAITGVSAQNEQIDERYVMTVLTPLNVHLPSKLGLNVDGGAASSFEYRNCNQAGCWVQVPLEKQLLVSLQKGNTASSRLRLMNGQLVNIKFSLTGLTKALEALDTGGLPKQAQ